MKWEKKCFIMCLLFYWIPNSDRKGPMNYGPVFYPSVCPFDSFLGIGSLVFSETLHGIRGPCGDVNAGARYFWKIPIIKMTENRKKWQETGFWDFENQLELVLSGNSVKPKFLWSINILQKVHAREKSGFKLWPKMLFSNQISVFFNWQ